MQAISLFNSGQTPRKQSQLNHVFSVGLHKERGDKLGRSLIRYNIPTLCEQIRQANQKLDLSTQSILLRGIARIENRQAVLLRRDVSNVESRLILSSTTRNIRRKRQPRGPISCDKDKASSVTTQQQQQLQQPQQQQDDLYQPGVIQYDEHGYPIMPLDYNQQQQYQQHMQKYQQRLQSLGVNHPHDLTLGDHYPNVTTIDSLQDLMRSSFHSSIHHRLDNLGDVYGMGHEEYNLLYHQHDPTASHMTDMGEMTTSATAAAAMGMGDTGEGFIPLDATTITDPSTAETISDLDDFLLLHQDTFDFNPNDKGSSNYDPTWSTALLPSHLDDQLAGYNSYTDPLSSGELGAMDDSGMLYDAMLDDEDYHELFNLQPQFGITRHDGDGDGDDGDMENYQPNLIMRDRAYMDPYEHAYDVDLGTDQFYQHGKEFIHIQPNEPLKAKTTMMDAPSATTGSTTTTASMASTQQKGSRKGMIPHAASSASSLSSRRKAYSQRGVPEMIEIDPEISLSDEYLAQCINNPTVFTIVNHFDHEVLITQQQLDGDCTLLPSLSYTQHQLMPSSSSSSSSSWPSMTGYPSLLPHLHTPETMDGYNHHDPSANHHLPHHQQQFQSIQQCLAYCSDQLQYISTRLRQLRRIQQRKLRQQQKQQQEQSTKATSNDYEDIVNTDSQGVTNLETVEMKQLETTQLYLYRITTYLQQQSTLLEQQRYYYELPPIICSQGDPDLMSSTHSRLLQRSIYAGLQAFGHGYDEIALQQQILNLQVDDFEPAVIAVAQSQYHQALRHHYEYHQQLKHQQQMKQALVNHKGKRADQLLKSGSTPREQLSSPSSSSSSLQPQVPEIETTTPPPLHQHDLTWGQLPLPATTPSTLGHDISHYFGIVYERGGRATNAAGVMDSTGQFDMTGQRDLSIHYGANRHHHHHHDGSDSPFDLSSDSFNLSLDFDALDGDVYGDLSAYDAVPPLPPLVTAEDMETRAVRDDTKDTGEQHSSIQLFGDHSNVSLLPGYHSQYVPSKLHRDLNIQTQHETSGDTQQVTVYGAMPSTLAHVALYSDGNYHDTTVDLHLLSENAILFFTMIYNCFLQHHHHKAGPQTSPSSSALTSSITFLEVLHLQVPDLHRLASASAAESFVQLMTLANNHVIVITQSTAYTDIHITKGPNYDQLIHTVQSYHGIDLTAAASNVNQTPVTTSGNDDDDDDGDFDDELHTVTRTPHSMTKHGHHRVNQALNRQGIADSKDYMLAPAFGSDISSISEVSDIGTDFDNDDDNDDDSDITAIRHKNKRQRFSLTSISSKGNRARHDTIRQSKPSRGQHIDERYKTSHRHTKGSGMLDSHQLSTVPEQEQSQVLRKSSRRR